MEDAGQYCNRCPDKKNTTPRFSLFPSTRLSYRRLFPPPLEGARFPVGGIRDKKEKGARTTDEIPSRDVEEGEKERERERVLFTNSVEREMQRKNRGE